MSGVMIKHMSVADCEKIMPPETYAADRRVIQKVKKQNKNNTIGNFETVMYYFHDVKKGKTAFEIMK